MLLNCKIMHNARVTSSDGYSQCGYSCVLLNCKIMPNTPCIFLMQVYWVHAKFSNFTFFKICTSVTSYLCISTFGVTIRDFPLLLAYDEVIEDNLRMGERSL